MEKILILFEKKILQYIYIYIYMLVYLLHCICALQISVRNLYSNHCTAVRGYGASLQHWGSYNGQPVHHDTVVPRGLRVAVNGAESRQSLGGRMTEIAGKNGPRGEDVAH